MQQMLTTYAPPQAPYFHPPHPQFPHVHSPFPSTNQTNSEKQNAQNNKQGRRGRKFRKFYCWTHGVTNHSSDRCLTPAQGHQPNASLYNRMGGSETICPTNTNE